MGASALSQDPFRFAQEYLENYKGACIGKEGLNLIVKRLTARILSKGYSTTRLGIPAQDLSSGTLTLTLVPGVIRTIRFADPSLSGTWKNAFPSRLGQLLNLHDIEQGLEQMKRLPSQDVDMEIVPGALPGESDVVITVKRIKPWKVNRWGMSWFNGQSDLEPRTADAPTYRYTLQTLDASLYAPFKLLGQSFNYIGALRAEATRSALFQSEQFSIGNRYTVRGFDGEQTLAAERGVYVRNELEMPLAQSKQAVYVGLDVGRLFGPSAQYPQTSLRDKRRGPARYL